jgi:hypothetical protein
VYKRQTAYRLFQGVLQITKYRPSLSAIEISPNTDLEATTGAINAMTIKVYGHAGTVCTKRVLITLHELNLPYELIKIDLAKGEHRTPEFYAKHPIGRVPYLEDDEGGRVIGLAESRPICRYLVVRYGADSTLMPKPTDIESLVRFEEVSLEGLETRGGLRLPDC